MYQDSNLAIPTYSGDLNSYLNRNLRMDESKGLNDAFGFDNARANYDFVYGGNVYRLNNLDNGMRNVSQVDTVARRTSQQAEEKRKAAIAPAIASYEASKPEIESAYNTETSRLTGEKQPLMDRYQVLLDQIKGKETTATNRQTLTTNNEMAKRGISNDSGMYQQEMTNVLNPITSEYAGLTKDTTLAREGGLRDIDNAITGLVPKKTADLRAITQAIADLQANTGNQSVTDFLNLTQQGFQNSLSERQLNEQIRQNNIAEALKRLELSSAGSGNTNQYATLSEGQTLYDLLNKSPIYTANKTYKPAAVGAGDSGW